MFRIRKVTFAAACLLLLTAACSDRSGTTGGVETVLRDAVEQIRTTQDQSFSIVIPGLAAAAVIDGAGSVPVPVASGTANPPGDTPLTTAERFHVGSITKTFTAALIMQLDEAGQLSLADPISNWITFPNGQNITLAMLLGHTSGIPSFEDLPGHTRDETPEQSIALAAEHPPLFPPGASWSYSNTNYVILGVIAGKVTGSTWDDEIRQRFFEPLQLNDTYVWTGTEKPPTASGSVLDCARAGDPGCAIVPVTDGFNWTVAWASGSVVSTPSDVARWMKALIAGDVLDAAHLALLTTATPQSVAVLSAMPAYGPLRWTGDGLGLLRYEIDGQGTGWGHEGGIEGFVANVVHMNDSNQIVAMASNLETVDAFEVIGRLVVATGTLDR